jgi:hypothetical protein
MVPRVDPGMVTVKVRHNYRLHLTACGTLAPDWRPELQAAGDAKH